MSSNTILVFLARGFVFLHDSSSVGTDRLAKVHFIITFLFLCLHVDKFLITVQFLLFVKSSDSELKTSTTLKDPKSTVKYRCRLFILSAKNECEAHAGSIPKSFDFTLELSEKPCMAVKLLYFCKV